MPEVRVREDVSRRAAGEGLLGRRLRLGLKKAYSESGNVLRTLTRIERGLLGFSCGADVVGRGWSPPPRACSARAGSRR